MRQLKAYSIIPVEDGTRTPFDAMRAVADILDVSESEIIHLIGFDNIAALREYAFHNPKPHFKFQTFMMNRLNYICKSKDAPVRIGRAPSIRSEN